MRSDGGAERGNPAPGLRLCTRTGPAAPGPAAPAPHPAPVAPAVRQRPLAATGWPCLMRPPPPCPAPARGVRAASGAPRGGQRARPVPAHPASRAASTPHAVCPPAPVLGPGRHWRAQAERDGAQPGTGCGLKPQDGDRVSSRGVRVQTRTTGPLRSAGLGVPGTHPSMEGSRPWSSPTAVPGN